MRLFQRRPRTFAELRGRTSAGRVVTMYGHRVTARHRLAVDGPEAILIRFRAVRPGALRRGLHVWCRGGVVTLAGRLAATATVWADEQGAGEVRVQVLNPGPEGTVELGNIWRSTTRPSAAAVTTDEEVGYQVQGGLQSIEVHPDVTVLRCAQRVDDGPIDPVGFADRFADLVVEVRRGQLAPPELDDLRAAYAARTAVAEERERRLLEQTPARGPLPAFRYHPDPVRTGAFVRSATPCFVCAQTTGWTYANTTYARDLETLEGDGLCPWCLASGRAAEQFDARFVDLQPHGGPRPPLAVVTELEQRTPGISWRYADGWCVHCDDACAYLGEVTAQTYPDLSPEEQAAVRRTEHGSTYLRHVSADPDLAPSHLFRCLHCGHYDAVVR